MIDFHFCFEAVLKPGRNPLVTETWTEQLCRGGLATGCSVPISHHACVLSRWVLSNSFATPWNADCQAPLSRGFPSKNTGVGCYFLLQGMDLPDPGIKPASPAFAGGFFTTEPPGKPSSVSPQGLFFFFFFSIPAPNGFYNLRLLHSHPVNPFTFKWWVWRCRVNACGKALFVSFRVPHSSWKNWHSSNSGW